jgi:uncharacterized protein (DUF2267 family)
MITIEQAAQEAIEALENIARAERADDHYDAYDYHQGVANELRQALAEQAKTIAALNQRIDFLNAKWNESEPLYSTN